MNTERSIGSNNGNAAKRTRVVVQQNAGGFADAETVNHIPPETKSIAAPGLRGWLVLQSCSLPNKATMRPHRGVARPQRGDDVDLEALQDAFMRSAERPSAKVTRSKVGVCLCF